MIVLLLPSSDRGLEFGVSVSIHKPSISMKLRVSLSLFIYMCVGLILPLRTGGGVMIQIGYMQARPWGVAAVYTAGSTWAVGGGVLVCVGCSLFDPLIALTEAGAGAGLSFAGAGEVVFVGCPSYLTTIVKAVVSCTNISTAPFLSIF